MSSRFDKNYARQKAKLDRQAPVILTEQQIDFHKWELKELKRKRMHMNRDLRKLEKLILELTDGNGRFKF